MTTPPVSRAGIAATFAAALVVIAGLITLGMPSRARERRMDGLRVEDLAQLSLGIEGYLTKHAMLPQELDSLASDGIIDRVPKDPKTNAPYSYRVSGARSYRLCATFAQPSDSMETHGRMGTNDVFAGSRHSWRHGAGESCFDLTPPAKESK